MTKTEKEKEGYMGKESNVTCVACNVDTRSVGNAVGMYDGANVGLPWSLAGFRVGMPARQSVGW